MKKLLVIIFCVLTFNVNALEKETTFNKQMFDKAQSEGKFVIVSSWVKYCSSCAGQMKILKTAQREGELLSLIHISEPTRLLSISDSGLCV